MTSKNLCFKLMIEDLKRRIWTMALLLLGFFFSIVVPIAYAGSIPLEDYSSHGMWMRHVRTIIFKMAGKSNPFVVVVLVVGAVVCAVSGFSYLHSARQIDFYHSIPVKRSRLFVVSYVNGILMPAVLYFLTLALGVLTVYIFKIDHVGLISTVLTAYCFHMAYYCLLYTTAVLVMMLTGNIIIALLGIVVFFVYGPGVTLLISGYNQVWWETYIPMKDYGPNAIYEKLMMHTSPFFNYIKNLETDTSGHLLALTAMVLLVTLVLAVCACLLYQKRPSEAAGQALAFPKSKMPIKVLLVVPIALICSLFFWELRSTMPWAIFGLLCGAVVTHCLMEIIYHFDFRKLFSHKIHLLCCIVGSFLILCGFKYDLFGYDSYLPGRDQVKSVAICMNTEEDWITYGGVELRTYDNEKIYEWRYENNLDYVAKHMALTNVDDILSIAQKGIAQKGMETYAQSENDYPEGITIQYTLNSGRKVARHYGIYRNQIDAELRRISDNPEYKMGTYPLLLQTPEETRSISFQQFDRTSKVRVEAGSRELADLLLAYQEELKGLTIETRKQEVPIATIQFRTEEHEKAVESYYEQSYDYRHYTGNTEDRCYYPIYPSFTNTRKLLKAAGIEILEQIPLKEVQYIKIQKNLSWEEKDSSQATQEITYQTPEEIEALLPALVFCDYANMNRMTSTAWEDAEVQVVLTAQGGERGISCYLDSNRIPDFLRADLR
ncbi:MAG: DUF6449 domain-containing protein [Hungatella sp.]